MTSPAPALPRLTYLRIKNYRALRDVEFRDLTPLTVLIGPNGSGKSTVLDALDFLAEAVRGNLVDAWEKRDRFEGMRTRGSEGNIEFEVSITLPLGTALHYCLIVGERDNAVFIVDESLSRIGEEPSRLFYLYKTHTIPNGLPNTPHNLYKNHENEYKYGTQPISLLLSILRVHPGVIDEELLPSRALAEFIVSYRRIHLTDDHLAGFSTKGARERLSTNGDNMPNVLYYLHTKHPETLAKITAQLRRWVPNLADIVPEITSDKRLLLRFKDAPFGEPLPAEYMSGGTMRLAALLTLLYEPDASGLLGIEEPENELHPQLLGRLAEELMRASETRQLLVTTHSPLLLDAFSPAEVWVMHRGPDGYARATRVADLPHVPEMVEDGSPLGYLWTSNGLRVGNPLAPYNPASDAR